MGEDELVALLSGRVVLRKDAVAVDLLPPDEASRIADGRYRLGVDFSDGVLAAGEDAPQLRVFNSESEIYAYEGETMTLASAVDPQTGDLVEAELTIEVVK